MANIPNTIRKQHLVTNGTKSPIKIEINTIADTKSLLQHYRKDSSLFSAHGTNAFSIVIYNREDLMQLALKSSLYTNSRRDLVPAIVPNSTSVIGET